MSDNRLPGRGPFLAPPPEVLRQLEVTLEKMILEEGDTVGFPLMDLSGVEVGGETRLAGAKGMDFVSASMVRFEYEKIEGDAAKELLIRLASQPDD